MELDQHPYSGTDSPATAALVDAYLAALVRARDEVAAPDRTLDHAFALLGAICARIDGRSVAGPHTAALVEACFETLAVAWADASGLARAVALGTALRRTVAHSGV